MRRGQAEGLQIRAAKIVIPQGEKSRILKIYLHQGRRALRKSSGVISCIDPSISAACFFSFYYTATRTAREKSGDPVSSGAGSILRREGRGLEPLDISDVCTIVCIIIIIIIITLSFKS